ncbi:hypothetical protein BDV38DRAFT_249286 [Aspergillus pseudotamarii]|uniref:BTB domain-containing protein n=1 Tax=Aspergillus pseudotamarii TaxID=132259 RepID=A0A5N6ST56_ASPPS|nr:uncharacterized protein BDV38DRAFT_249286 [Aspergillus pseudotamarii]KAE8136573.1 hypothetical protein BDV38DRAFT_249286 [Aspergillus pseudotamarii]
MSEKDLSQVQPADEGLSLEQIDPDGNVILLVEGRSTAQFLVSSKILSMASPMFAKLFDSNFSEGIQVASSSCPTISLHEDDTAAMRTILRILHYQDPTQDNPITAEAFAVLAIQCNKYDCIRAICPWTFKWFSDLEAIKTAEEYCYLLLAAHFFRSEEQFRKISARAQVQLSSSFCVKWETLEIMDLLPDDMKNELVDRIENLLNGIHAELQAVEDLLRKSQKYYIMDGLVCPNCARTHPSEARKCHPCKNGDLITKYCNSDSRIAEYFAILGKANLWPSVEPFQSCSATEIALRISQSAQILRHSCQGLWCPLQSELNMLVRKVNGIIGSVKGLDLYPLHQTSPGV